MSTGATRVISVTSVQITIVFRIFIEKEFTQTNVADLIQKTNFNQCADYHHWPRGKNIHSMPWRF